MKRPAFAARGHRFEPGEPFPIFVSRGNSGLACKFNMNLGAGWCAAPDRERYLSLQDSIVTKDCSYS